MKVFRSSSFFGGFWFLIRSPTKNTLTFARICQVVIFAPSNRVMVKAFMKNLPPKKVLILKKSGVKIPLVMSRPQTIELIPNRLALLSVGTIRNNHMFDVCISIQAKFKVTVISWSLYLS